MIAIRIPRQQWGKAWRAMVEIAPVRVVSKEPICEVYPAHLELLEARGFAYEVIDTRESAKHLAVRRSLVSRPRSRLHGARLPKQNGS